MVCEKGEDFAAARRATDLTIMKYKSQGQDKNYLQHLSRNLMHNLKDINNGITIPNNQRPPKSPIQDL